MDAEDEFFEVNSDMEPPILSLVSCLFLPFSMPYFVLVLHLSVFNFWIVAISESLETKNDGNVSVGSSLLTYVYSFFVCLFTSLGTEILRKRSLQLKIITCS